MARLIQVDLDKPAEDRLEFCRGLENGDILFFPKAPLDLPVRRRGGKLLDRFDPKGFVEQADAFLSALLPPYSVSAKLSRIGLPQLAKKRLSSCFPYRKHALHLDASFAQPTHGARILRFFANVHPEKSCRWVTSQSFEELLKQFGGEEGVGFPRSTGHLLPLGLERRMDEMLQSSGIQMSVRSPYDAFMFRLSRFLKGNREFQKDCPKEIWEFPPHSCWAAFTDQISHSAISGSHVWEETFLIPYKTLLYPDRAPVCILERLCDGNMVNPALANRLRCKR